MKLPRDKGLRANSTQLRKNATKEENHLWYDFLHEYPVRFNRQRIIGEYIVDFYCHKARLVVELDGAQHYEEDAIARDNVRTKFLEKQNLKVVRFSNLEVNRSFEAVCAMIDDDVKQRTR